MCNFIHICLICLGCLFTAFVCAEEKEKSAFLPSIRSEEVEYFQLLVQGNNRFAFDFFQSMRHQGGNLCFSPYSIISGLAMVAVGAKGETANKLQHVFRYPLSLLPLFGDLNGFLETPSSDSKNASQVFLANALWLQTDISVRPSFKQSLLRNFKFALQPLDFTKDLNQSIQVINQWSSQKTKGKINQLLNIQDLTSATHLLLTMGFFMKGQWEFPFDPKQTKRQPFNQTKRHSFLANMMQATLNCLIWQGDQWEMVVLPYIKGEQGAQLAMALLLPKENLSADLEKTLTWENWQQWLKQLQLQSVTLTLPRFRIEKRLDLSLSLQTFDLSQLFGPQANFSEITEEKGLFIYKAIQKTLLQVDEKGTEVTSITIGDKKNTLEVTNPSSYSFRADHPFIFIIWEQKTGSILLMGRLALP